jgi:hypothetical protein
MIEPFKLTASLDSDEIDRLLNNTQHGRISGSISTQRAKSLLTQEEASLTQPHIVRRLL